MNFPKDQELFENVSADGKVILPDSFNAAREHPRAQEIVEYNNLYVDFVFQASSYDFDMKDILSNPGKVLSEQNKRAADGKQDLLEKQQKLVDDLFRTDYICGFLPAESEIHTGQINVKADYFAEHGILSNTNRESVCGGAFSRLRDILFGFFRPVVHPFCFLLSLACAYILSFYSEGYLTFWPCAIMVLAGVVLFFTDFEEDHLSKFVCSIFFKIAAAVLSVLAIAGGFRHATPMAMPVMYYYIAAVASMLVDFLIHLLKCTRNRKLKKEFCSTYEAYAQDIHRYIRYHVLWWDHIHPGEPLPVSIEQMNRDFNMFSQNYKRFK